MPFGHDLSQYCFKDQIKSHKKQVYRLSILVGESLKLDKGENT